MNINMCTPNFYALQLYISRTNVAFPYTTDTLTSYASPAIFPSYYLHALLVFPLTYSYSSLVYTTAINTLHFPISRANSTFPYTTTTYNKVLCLSVPKLKVIRCRGRRHNGALKFLYLRISSTNVYRDISFENLHAFLPLTQGNRVTAHAIQLNLIVMETTIYISKKINVISPLTTPTIHLLYIP